MVQQQRWVKLGKTAEALFSTNQGSGTKLLVVFVSSIVIYLQRKKANFTKECLD